MSNRQDILQTLRKIEALFAGATTEGERQAAGEARKRIQARLAGLEKEERSIEVRMSLDNPWSRRLFIALCRRYGVRPFRYSGQKRSSIMVSLPRSFLEATLLPEFNRLNDVLIQHLSNIADEIVAAAISPETSEPEERKGIAPPN